MNAIDGIGVSGDGMLGTETDKMMSEKSDRELYVIWAQTTDTTSAKPLKIAEIDNLDTAISICGETSRKIPRAKFFVKGKFYGKKYYERGYAYPVEDADTERAVHDLVTNPWYPN
ncbi:MAG: hypothetical protein ISN29_05035 [Gammaproteobacteria bacterium AqS3]|nr:hypothetical protein [Gammaproteobacteria bacterium AqS3]